MLLQPRKGSTSISVTGGKIALQTGAAGKGRAAEKKENLMSAAQTSLL